ncbi:MAG: 5-formyltetrahydrofolate cyclo-ligase [Sulfolobales archaeon]|nr:5-formyltetrahydrofolate cyclo-ligase [Sulfolobales archaeon]MCX8209009.1 5-formyltetrahydrofolate cyclo-ligase [Sulfolobales archaeon]MDW8010019.1 5-formyltetrahydrofolate cyclo-ligase [Sulfolobales archaeon]
MSEEVSREKLRYTVWRLMEERNIAAFPRPVYGRIPNFIGAETAAARLASSDLFKKAGVVKVNPDAPQRKVRELVLKAGKLLVVPTPRISEGFLLIDPRRVPSWLHGEASTIPGSFRYGTRVDPEEIPEVDLVVAGSVVVSVFGERLGKGEGYSEIEYGILFEYGKLSEEVPIITTVHDVQVVEFRIPLEPWDVTVDFVFTPTRTIRCESGRKRPRGILWDYLDTEKIEAIPTLKALAEKKRVDLARR